MKLEIKKLKTWDTHDGGGYQGELLMDGQRCAYFHNDGNGGPVDWRPFSADLFAKLQQHVQALPPLPPDPVFHGMVIPMDLDIFIGGLIDDTLQERQMKRWCRTKTVFRLPGDPEGEYRTIKAPYTEQVKVHLFNKYGGQAQIINERFI